MPDVSSISLNRQQISATTLANAAELISDVVMSLSGNEIANTIGGELATSDLIQTIALQRMTNKILEVRKV